MFRMLLFVLVSDFFAVFFKAEKTEISNFTTLYESFLESEYDRKTESESR